MNKPEADTRYINRVMDHPLPIGAQTAAVPAADKGAGAPAQAGEEYDDILMEAVVKGRKGKIVDLVKEAVEQGRSPQEIIDESLIPGINRVGELFDAKKYYLPQLISSAETMETGIGYLEPILAASRDREPMATIVLATVEHDIHDIGKNLVALMLRNYGYRVIDLGKDVPAEKILDTAQKEDADIIGLSALMTTTMMEMDKVVKMARERKIRAQIIIGGAVITQSFCDEIGADGYSEDAQEAVKLVSRLLGLGQ